MSNDSRTGPRPWYSGITRYQWMVLVVASLGWVFDIFEGQIFVASMRDAMPDLLGVSPIMTRCAPGTTVPLASSCWVARSAAWCLA